MFFLLSISIFRLLFQKNAHERIDNTIITMETSHKRLLYFPVAIFQLMTYLQDDYILYVGSIYWRENLKIYNNNMSLSSK